MEPNYRKPLDTVLLACSVLKRLGTGSLDTLPERVRSQKVQYFAQLFGVSPAYSYNLYLRGPYSPDLAWDLYQFKESGQSAPTERFVSDELEGKFKQLESFIKEKSVRQLELVATLHWLRNVATLNAEEAERKLRELKNANEEELRWATEELKKVPA